jgi:hypothetical protein
MWFLLDAFSKLQKATIWFVMSSCPVCMYVCLSVCPHGKTWLLLDVLSRNLISLDFSKICREN